MSHIASYIPLGNNRRISSHICSLNKHISTSSAVEYMSLQYTILISSDIGSQYITSNQLWYNGCSMDSDEVSLISVLQCSILTAPSVVLWAIWSHGTDTSKTVDGLRSFLNFRLLPPMTTITRLSSGSENFVVSLSFLPHCKRHNLEQ